MALATFSDLQTAISNWLNRNDTNIPLADFIRLAEAELNVRVRVRQNMTTIALTLTMGADSVALPSDFAEEIELNYAASSDELLRASYNDLDRARGAGLTGKPQNYAVAGSTIVFDRLSDATYSLTLRYYKTWDLAADSTNWLLTTHPDCYLFGALAEANAWLGDMGPSEYARSRRDMAIQRALNADSRMKTAPLRSDAALLRAGRYDITAG